MIKRVSHLAKIVKVPLVFPKYTLFSQVITVVRVTICKTESFLSSFNISEGFNLHRMILN